MTTRAPEIITIAEDADEVCCDGGGGALGHPVVWYTFEADGTATCGYCDRQYVKSH